MSDEALECPRCETTPVHYKQPCPGCGIYISEYSSQVDDLLVRFARMKESVGDLLDKYKTLKADVREEPLLQSELETVSAQLNSIVQIIDISIDAISMMQPEPPVVEEMRQIHRRIKFVTGYVEHVEMSGENTPVINMQLCEQNHVVLKPGVLYYFHVNPDCAHCKEIAEKYE